MSLEKEEKIHRFRYDYVLGMIEYPDGEWIEYCVHQEQTEKLREDYEDCICCGGSGEIDEGEEPYEVKINDCPCCKGKGIIHKELQQTKEKLKRCEEVVDGFKKNILLLEKLRQSGNNYLDVATNSIIDKLITQLKDNG